MGRKCFSFRTPHFRTPFRTDFHENVRNEEHFLYGDSPLKIKNLKSGFLHAREDQKIGPEPKCHVPRFSLCHFLPDYFYQQTLLRNAMFVSLISAISHALMTEIVDYFINSTPPLPFENLGT